MVREVYGSLLMNENLENEKFHKQILHLPIPSNVKGIVRKVAHDRLQTIDNLKKGRSSQMTLI